MSKRKELKGIITAMVTPFDEHQELDLEAAKNMARWLVDKGVHGLFIAGTNGEFHLLSNDEKVALTEAVVEEVNGEVPVISGGGCCSTKETIQLSQRLKEAGADYISLVTPYYLVPNQEDLYWHYRNIAESVDMPFLLYNIPGLAGINIDPETVSRLAEIKNIVGIKDSGGNFENQKQYIEISKAQDFDVMNGSDSLMLDAFKCGSIASVAATSNVLPEIEVRLYERFVEGEIDLAQKEREKIDLLRMTLKKCAAPSVMKKTLNLMGIQAGITRRPVQEPKQEVVKEIERMIEQYGILER